MCNYTKDVTERLNTCDTIKKIALENIEKRKKSFQKISRKNHFEKVEKIIQNVITLSQMRFINSLNKH